MNFTGLQGRAAILEIREGESRATSSESRHGQGSLEGRAARKQGDDGVQVLLPVRPAKHRAG